MSSAPPIALTCGESAGIGPDLCVAVAQQSRDYPLVCLADRTMLQARAQQLHLPCQIHEYAPDTEPARGAGELTVLHQPLACPAVAGHVEMRNAPAVLRLIERAVEGCQRREFAAMVTAPVHKSVLNDAGIPFTGHTEYIAATIPHAGLLILPNVSHFAFLQDPKMFNFAILHFLGDE